VLPWDGATVLGIGRVTGGYTFDESADFPHRRPVEWLALGDWRLPYTEGLRNTVHQVRNMENQVSVERSVFSVTQSPWQPGRQRLVHRNRLFPQG
jgi:predicted Mrr-cat superfamily restriction endonuclease